MDDNSDFTLQSAQTAAADGELKTWATDFLASPGSDNADLADMLDDMTVWRGPLRLPFTKLNRLAGPPGQPTLARLDEDDLETVEGMADSIDEGWDPPPLIVSVRDGQFVVEDGNHRTEGLRRSGEVDYWCVVCGDDAEELDRMIEDHTG